MSAVAPEPAGERFVSESDEVALARLITEISWRVDHGTAATVHELFVDDGEIRWVPTRS